MSIDKTLAERGARYGDFTDHAIYAQGLQTLMHGSDNWKKMSADKRQALTVIADKIARILTGDPEYKDNWHDIQGYAKLAEDRCVEPSAPEPTTTNMRFEEAKEAVRKGEADRIAKPGEWRVWREDGIVRSEIFRAETIVAGEWIEWPGGRMPVDFTTQVEVKFLNQETDIGQANSYHWRHIGNKWDIVAYRILPEQFAN